MSAMEYVALLRGINVGGSNVIKMADLRACLQAAGFADVATYIQSGNVLLGGGQDAGERIADDVATALAGTFGYAGTVMVRSRTQLRAVIADAPSWMGADPSEFRTDCIFLKAPLTPDEALATIPTREGVDRVETGPGVLYCSRLASRAAQSRLSRVASLPIYPSITIRNWNTTTKLMALMDQRASR